MQSTRVPEESSIFKMFKMLDALDVPDVDIDDVNDGEVPGPSGYQRPVMDVVLNLESSVEHHQPCPVDVWNKRSSVSSAEKHGPIIMQAVHPAVGTWGAMGVSFLDALVAPSAGPISRQIPHLLPN
jgi:hypothetical protein